MSFTGIIHKIWATRFFRSVTVRFRGAYETKTTRTVSEGKLLKTFKFPSRWRAELYKQRINKGQFHRYIGTEYGIGLTKSKNTGKH